MAKKKYETIDITQMEDDIIIEKSKKNALDFKDKSWTDAVSIVKADGNDLVITTNSEGSKKVILKDYFAKGGKHPIKYFNSIGEGEKDVSILDYVNTHNIIGAAQIITTAKKGKITGTVFNDLITGTENGEKIYGYGGNDTINGSLGADNMSGGAGRNVYKYTDFSHLDGDKITLTKGENAIIDLSELNITATYRVVGKDLEVTAGEHKFTILNFGTKDVTNNKTKKTADTSSVVLIDKTGEVNLRTTLINSDKGTWHNDYIKKDGYEIYKKGVLVEDVTKKGLSISGGAGNDTIIGTNYSDTLNGGDGADSLDGGTGNDVIKAATGTGDSIIGGLGSDKLYASTTKDSETIFLFNAGDGNDTVYSGKGEDTLKFNDMQLENITMLQGIGKNSKDLVIKYTNSDTVTIKDYYKVNKKGVITGINSSNSIKYITTTEGTFNISDYADKFKFGWGKGLNDSQHYTITMNSASIQDAIMFNKNATIRNLKFIKEGDNLRIWYNDDNSLDLSDYESGKVHVINDGTEIYKVGSYALCSSVTIKDYFATETQAIDKIILKYDDTWTHKNTEFSIQKDSVASSNDVVGFENIIDLDSETPIQLGTYADNVCNASKFADFIYTRRGDGEGDTTYAGDGNDCIITWGRSDIVYGQDGNDYIGGNRNCLVLDGGAGDDTICVSSATGVNTQGYVSVIGGIGNDKITGYLDEKQRYEFNYGDGNDTVTSTSGHDVLKFNDVELSELEYTKDGDDIVINYGESDSITLINALKNLTTINIEDKDGNITTALEECHIIKGIGAFSGTDNAETLYGSAENDTITGKKENDEIYGKAGDDIFVFNTGDGDDTVYQGSLGDVDTLKFADAELSDLNFDKDGENDLIISHGNGDSVTVKDYFITGNTVTKWTDKNGTTYDLATVNRHAINSTEETVNGTIFNDVITVNAANTTIDGKEGANTYVISQNGTYNITSTSGRDTIEFSDVELDTLNFNVSENNVVIRNSTNSLRVIITDYIVNMPTLYVKGQTGEPVTIITQLANAGIIYSDASTINGKTDTADRIFGGDSANTIDGKGGADIINGGKGNDTFQFKKGYGDATIVNGTEIDEVDTIQFVDSALDELDYEVSDSDLVIKYNEGADLVTVKGYYTNSNTVKNLITTDGEYSVSDIRHVIAGDSTAISGTDLNDKIIGTDDNDTITSSLGDDILIGGKGEDTFEITKWGGGFAGRQHTTIVMGEDTKQDTILFNAIDFAGNLANFVFEKEGDNLVIWYNYDYDIENIKELDYGKVLYRGSYIYRNGNYAYCSNITIKDYFTADQTIDKIVINRYGDPSNSMEYSILNDSKANPNGSTGFANYSDLDSPASVVLGSYADNLYTGTKYADLLYTRRGSGNGDVVSTGAGNDFIYTWGRTDTIYTGDGNDYVNGNTCSPLVDLGAGNDTISLHSSTAANPQGYVNIYGGEGNDSITAGTGVVHVYTNSEEGGKDTTADVMDEINMEYNTNNGNEIYAQSETNRITGGSGNDNYYAYIDQKTYINDKGGDADNLTLTNTPDTTDGYKSNLHVLFNVSSTYTPEQGISAIGNIIITDTATKANYDAWKANSIGGDYTGISIRNNAIENIHSSDDYTLTSANIAALGETVAGWLSNNTEFASVNALFEEGTDEQITALIAQFDNAGWTK